MGGWNSGRYRGMPIADSAMKIDFCWMLRSRHAVPGQHIRGSLSWTCRGEPSGNISYTCNMTDPDNSWMELRFTVTTRSTGEKRDFVQHVQMSSTVPHFGGRRWWLHCPVNGSRVAKLYCPRGGDIFASRTAWKLGYHIQRVPPRDRHFEALFSLQRKLGCEVGWGNIIRRPKGMWNRTFDRHWERFLDLDDRCAVEMATFALRLGGHLR